MKALQGIFLQPTEFLPSFLPNNAFSLPNKMFHFV